MEDLIRRSDAIKGAKRLHNLFSSPFYNRDRVEMIEAYFNDIPSAESTGDLDNAIYEYVKEGLMDNPYDRPQGEWIYGEHNVAMCDGYRCNRCDFFVSWDYEHKFIDFINDYHFCPNCGARMKGADDGIR